MHPGPASSEGCGPTSFRREAVTAVDGASLSALVSGSGTGPPLLLIHGFTGAADAWGDSLLRRLASTHRRVVAMDLIGHGESDPCHDPARYRLDRVIDDVVRVQESLIGEPAVWIGYSMGGRIALAAGAMWLAPQRGLILESASPGLSGPHIRQERTLADEELARLLERAGIEPFVDRWLAQPLFATQHALPSDVRQRERERRLSQDPHSLAACLRGLGSGVQPSVWGRLHYLRAPMLLIVGELDEKFVRVARLMAEEAPSLRYVEVPGAGHAVHLECPEAWIAAVESWSSGR